jgi:hypothetical protein
MPELVTVRSHTHGTDVGVYHTDPDCHVIDQMASPQERPLDSLADGVTECRHCDGSFGESHPDEYGPNLSAKLANLNPDDVGPQRGEQA